MPRSVLGCLRPVNILIWTSRKSVGHGTNDRVMVHGDDDGPMAAGPVWSQHSQIVGRETDDPRRHLVSSNVAFQPGELARTTTGA